MGLRALISGSGFGYFFSFGVHIIVSLGFAGNTIRTVKPGIEPLRRIGRGMLPENHICKFIVKDFCVFIRIEIPIVLAPLHPAVCHAVCYFFNRSLTACFAIGFGHAGAPEIFLCKDIGSYLAPVLRYFHILHVKYLITIGVTDDGTAFFILELVVWAYIILCKKATKLQALVLLGFHIHNFKNFNSISAQLPDTSGQLFLLAKEGEAKGRVFFKRQANFILFKYPP